eukprot:m.146263 g.146263  ORF g.146263 m.146263 type:complete len:140 (+) comp38449_c0_seq24:661-1080(+)
MVDTLVREWTGARELSLRPLVHIFDITPLSADVFLYWTTGNQGGLQKGGFTVVSLQQLLCRKIWIVLWPGKDEQVNLLWYTSDPDAGHLGSLVSMEPELIAINSANSALSYFSSWNLLHLDMGNLDNDFSSGRSIQLGY